MLASFVVFLKPRQMTPLGQSIGRSLHGLLLELIRQVNPSLATKLHSDARAKPFTVSMLQGRFEYRDERPHVLPSETYRVRYTVLSDAVFNALSHVLLGKRVYGEAVIIDGQPYDIADIVVEPRLSQGWARLSSYEQLVEQALTGPQVELEFASPTTFRQGDINLLFPLPVSIFGSYLRRWQAFSPVKLDETGFLDFVEQHVVAERYKLQTELVRYGAYSFHGLVGTCRYRALRDEQRHVHSLNVLADFALFCGTGQKTPQGMGQTRRL